jgi:hypothetical protein
MIRACRRFVRRHGRSCATIHFLRRGRQPGRLLGAPRREISELGERAREGFTAERAESAENGGSERNIAAVGRIFQQGLTDSGAGSAADRAGSGADSPTIRVVNEYGPGRRGMGGQACPASVKQKSGIRHDRKGCFAPGTFGGRSRRYSECPPGPRSSPHPPSCTTPVVTPRPDARATEATSRERRAMRPVR